MSRPKVLFFANLPPLPVDRGDKNRLFHVLKLLSQFADVRLVYLSRRWEPDVADWKLLDGIELHPLAVGKEEVVWQGVKSIASLRPFVAFRFGRPRLVEAVGQQADEFRADVFWAYGIPAYPFLRRLTGLRRVLDLADSPSLYNSMTRMSSEMPMRARLQSLLQWRMRHYEKLAVQASTHVLVASLRDQEHLLRLHGNGQNVRVLENCVPGAILARQWAPKPGSPPRLLFVGNMTYPPNLAGVRLIARQIWPSVRSHFPEAEFIVCGRGGSRLSAGLRRQSGMRIVGYVEDLLSMYLEASVLVSPVPVVGGTQYKLLEAMALGLPIVARRASTEVGDMTPGRELLVGDSTEDLVAAVLSILKNPDFSTRLSVNARNFIRAHHVWESKLDFLRSLILD